jgi:SulP family sulfate permease
LIEKLPVLWRALPTMNGPSVALAAITIAIIVGLKLVRPNWPGMLAAVAMAAGLVAIFDLPVATIGTQFGGIPSSLPAPGLPDISLARIQELLPSALSFALLGSIESLLSAVVADGMTGGGTAPTANWSGRARPTLSRPCSAASASPARSRERPRMSAPARMDRWPG